VQLKPTKLHLCLCAANMFVFVKHFQQFVKFHSEMFIARKAKRENKQRKNRCARRVKQQTVVAKKNQTLELHHFAK